MRRKKSNTVPNCLLFKFIYNSRSNTFALIIFMNKELVKVAVIVHVTESDNSCIDFGNKSVVI